MKAYTGKLTNLLPDDVFVTEYQWKIMWSENKLINSIAVAKV